jgi:hypothetical protein
MAIHSINGDTPSGRKSVNQPQYGSLAVLKSGEIQMPSRDTVLDGTTIAYMSKSRIEHGISFDTTLDGTNAEDFIVSPHILANGYQGVIIDENYATTDTQYAVYSPFNEKISYIDDGTNRIYQINYNMMTTKYLYFVSLYWRVAGSIPSSLLGGYSIQYDIIGAKPTSFLFEGGGGAEAASGNLVWDTYYYDSTNTLIDSNSGTVAFNTMGFNSKWLDSYKYNITLHANTGY